MSDQTTSVTAPTLLLRPEEAARQLAIARCRIYDLIASGELASIKIGHSRRIPREALRAYVARLAAEQSQPVRSAS